MAPSKGKVGSTWIMAEGCRHSSSPPALAHVRSLGLPSWPDSLSSVSGFTRCSLWEVSPTAGVCYAVPCGDCRMRSAQAVNFAVGSRVWVEDEAEAWAVAEVVGKEKRSLKLRLRDQLVRSLIAQVYTVLLIEGTRTLHKATLPLG